MTNDTVSGIRDDIAAGRAIKRYIIPAEAWYASAVMPYRHADITGEISIGIDARDGGTYGEWVVNWRKLGHGIAVRLEIFDDAWLAFRAADFAEVLEQFEGGQAFSLGDFTSALTAAGWTDKTERQMSGRTPNHQTTP